MSHADGRELPGLSRVVVDAVEATSIRINSRVYELRRRGIEVLVLSLGEAYFDIPLYGLDDLPCPDLYHYSDSRGIPELREKIAAHYGAAYGVPVDPETEILITAGSKAAIYMTLLSVLDPGDEVIVQDPSWVSYPEQVKLCHGVPVTVPWDEPVEEYERYVTDRTQAIVVTTPHNPRGYVYGEREIQGLLDLAAKHDLWLLSDEAYSDFLLDETFCSVGRLDPAKRRSVVFNSLSKSYGISGWRLGYVIGHARLIDEVLKVNQHLLTCPATVLEYYLVRHFESLLEITKPQIEKVVALRRRIETCLDDLGLTYLAGSATFYLFVSIDPSRLDSEMFAARLLEEEHVCVVPGIGYGASCDRFVRVSVGTAPEAEIRRGLTRVKALIERTS